MVAKSQAVTAAHVVSFQLAHRSGLVIGAGSDAGTPLNAHGSLLPELSLMAKHGMSPLECLRAATSGAARLLRLADRLGRSRPATRGTCSPWRATRPRTCRRSPGCGWSSRGDGSSSTA